MRIVRGKCICDVFGYPHVCKMYNCVMVILVHDPKNLNTREENGHSINLHVKHRELSKGIKHRCKA
jgi:hypothetical protein